MNLEALGADISVYRAFESWAAQQLTLARVAAANRDHYRLFTERLNSMPNRAAGSGIAATAPQPCR